MQALLLVRAGASNRTIAAKLGISLQTAKWYVSNLLRRFRVPRRIDLILLGRRPSTAVPAVRDERRRR